ncbi:MAG TPA: hypothetical protein VGU01_14715 [Sphingomicrobium sp.]|nr:hypothetical protein [Sphingomicrobium sp.]
MRLPVIAFGCYGLVCASLVTGCSPNSSGSNNTMNVDENLTTTDMNATTSTAVIPTHRYDFKEGLTYGYISAVSEEDRKKGKGAGDVSMYIYHGNQDGLYKLTSVDANGRETGRYECTNPCVAIKADYGGVLNRIAYSPDTVIGAAFEDAMTGQLEPVHSAGRLASSFLPSAWAGEYKGTFEGNATGSVTIKDIPNGVKVSIGIGSPSCTGEIEFNANRPAADTIVHTTPADETYGSCKMTLTRDGANLHVEESSSCQSYHGAECSFNGQATR